MIFQDRREAGARLAEVLEPLHQQDDLLVLALPRGGVPVGYEVARALDAPLDVFVVRKLGVPGHEEFAMGAIASGGVRVFNEDVVERLDIDPDSIERVTRREQAELERREQLYRGGRPPAMLEGRTAILVDDGLATGATMRAAVQAVRKKGAKYIVVAAPVGSPRTCAQLEEEADAVVCAVTPEPFFGVGQWYDDFSQTSDEEVHDLLEAAARRKDGEAASP
jgi:putative phosphoribosyl transferase